MLFSCQNDDLQLENKEELLKSITFDNAELKNLENSRVNLVIFEVYIGRASRNCQSGWGLCNFRWFPDFREQDENTVLAKKEIRDNQTYFEIYFANEIPEGLSDNDLKMIVDEAITAYNSDTGESLTILSGEYNVDRNLGDFGGYKIILD